MFVYSDMCGTLQKLVFMHGMLLTWSFISVPYPSSRARIWKQTDRQTDTTTLLLLGRMTLWSHRKDVSQVHM